MKSREMTILAVALGAWMAWRLVGRSLIPIGSQEIGIAIIVLFKPWLDFRGWFTLLTINAISYIQMWYWSFITVSGIFNRGYFDNMRDMGLISESLLKNLPPSWVIALTSCGGFLYTFFIWPYIWERVYLKAGVWGKLKWEK